MVLAHVGEIGEFVSTNIPFSETEFTELPDPERHSNFHEDTGWPFEDGFRNAVRHQIGILSAMGWNTH